MDYETETIARELQRINGDVTKFATAQKGRHSELADKRMELQARVQELERKADVRRMGGDPGLPSDRTPIAAKLADGTNDPMFAKAVRLSDHYRSDGTQGDPFVIAEWVRDLMTGRKAASSTALVPVSLSAHVIDDVRAAATIIQAGAGTVVFDAPKNMAKITGDPTVYEHVEAAEDISESDVTVIPVALNPKALVALIPLTMEVVADSPNLDAVLRTNLTAAFAGKLFLVAQSVRAALQDANLVVESLHETERDLVLRVAVGSNAVPVPLDHRREFFVRFEALPFQACPPVLEEASRPALAFVIPELTEGFPEQIRRVQPLVRRQHLLERLPTPRGSAGMSKISRTWNRSCAGCRLTFECHMSSRSTAYDQ